MADRLPKVLRVLVDVGIGVTILAVVIAIAGVALSDAGLDVPIQFTPSEDAYALTSDAWGTGTISQADGIARFTERAPGLTIAFFAAVAAYAAGALVLLILLRGMLVSVGEGTPFQNANVRRIRWIGIVTIVFGLGVQAFQSIVAAVAMNTVDAQGLHLETRINPDLVVVFVGLLIVALAEVFGTGARLQDDADLTI